MKALKIVFAILFPVAVICGVLPLVYPLVVPAVEGGSIDFGELFKSFFELFKNFSSAQEMFGFPLFVMLAAFGFGGLLFILWLVFGIVKRRPIGILFGVIAALVLEVAALGVFINMSYVFAIEIGGLEENALYKVMEYVALGAVVLFIASFVVHVLIMFKAAKARKEAKKAKKAKQSQPEVDYSVYEINYKDLPPVLFEESKRDHDPEIVERHDNHVYVGENHVLKGHYVRDDEIEAILAAGSYRHEEEIPESILAFLDSKHEAEENGLDLPIFDPNFVPSKEDENMLTEEELFVLEALRNFAPKRREDVPSCVHEFLNRKPLPRKEEEVPEHIREFLNRKEEVAEESPVVSEEEQRIVDAMSRLEPKVEGPQYFGVSDEEYVDLPMFKEHEEPVEIIEEFIRIEEPEEEVDAPKLASSSPVHISKNKEGKYQLKQVGEKKPFAVYETEEEAIKVAEAVKKVNGVSVRIHDSEGKIRSL